MQSAQVMKPTLLAMVYSRRPVSQTSPCELLESKLAALPPSWAEITTQCLHVLQGWCAACGGRSQH